MHLSLKLKEIFAVLLLDQSSKKRGMFFLILSCCIITSQIRWSEFTPVDSKEGSFHLRLTPLLPELLAYTHMGRLPAVAQKRFLQQTFFYHNIFLGTPAATCKAWSHWHLGGPFWDGHRAAGLLSLLSALGLQSWAMTVDGSVAFSWYLSFYLRGVVSVRWPNGQKSPLKSIKT